MTNLHQTYIFQRYYFKAISALKNSRFLLLVKSPKSLRTLVKMLFQFFNFIQKIFNINLKQFERKNYFKNVAYLSVFKYL